MTNVEKRLFIVGAPRSGTTWLQLLFAQHPKVVTSSETHIYTQYLNLLEARWSHEISRKLKGYKVSGLTQIIDEPGFYAATRLFADHIYSQIAAVSPSSSVLLDKTPENLLHMNHILTHFPDAYVIHVIRDPRAVAASFQKASKGWWNWTQSGPISISNRWRNDVLAGRTIASKTSRYREVRYEELLHAGEEVIADLFEFIDEPLASDQCSDIFRRCAIDNLQSATDPALIQPWDIGAEPSDFFRRGSADSWRGDLATHEVYSIEKQLGSLLEELRYERVAAQENTVSKFRFMLSSISLKTLSYLVGVVRGLEWRMSDQLRKL